MAAEASVAVAYGWLIKDKLIDEKNFAHRVYELTEKHFFIDLTN